MNSMKICKIKAGNCKRFLGMKVKMWNNKSFSPRIISNYMVSRTLDGMKPEPSLL